MFFLFNKPCSLSKDGFFPIFLWRKASEIEIWSVTLHRIVRNAISPTSFTTVLPLRHSHLQLALARKTGPAVWNLPPFYGQSNGNKEHLEGCDTIVNYGIPQQLLNATNRQFQTANIGGRADSDRSAVLNIK